MPTILSVSFCGPYYIIRSVICNSTATNSILTAMNGKGNAWTYYRPLFYWAVVRPYLCTKNDPDHLEWPGGFCLWFALTEFFYGSVLDCLCDLELKPELIRNQRDKFRICGFIDIFRRICYIANDEVPKFRRPGTPQEQNLLEWR